MCLKKAEICIGYLNSVTFALHSFIWISAFSGLYLLVGYSSEEINMIQKNLSASDLEKAGFVSFDSNDISGLLQSVLETIMPEASP